MRNLRLIYMGRRGYYHLFSDGFRTDVLFEDTKAFVAAMNIVALCYLKCQVRILAFVLMDNHVHFILYGTERECMMFRDKFVHRYGMWFSNTYLGRRCSRLDFDIKLIDNERYLLNSIAYVIRNGIAAGYAYCADDYLWSSGGLYFRLPQRMEALLSSWKSVSDIPSTEYRRRFNTRDRFPSDWRVTPEGFIWPGNYVDYRLVESLFKSSNAFTFFMGQLKEREINESLSINEQVSLPDLELREKAVSMSHKLYGVTNLRTLDVRQRIALGKELRREYRCSMKQIARMIHLDPKYLKELL